MSWVGWNRQSDTFHLTLTYGGWEESAAAMASASPDRLSTSSSGSSSGSVVLGKDQEVGCRMELDWSCGDGEDQVVLRLQSHLMVSAPSPQDLVSVQLSCEGRSGDDANAGFDRADKDGDEAEEVVRLVMRVEKRREELRGMRMGRKGGGSGKEGDGGAGVLTRLLLWDFTGSGITTAASGGLICGEHWKTLTVVSLCGCGFSVLPVEITRLPLLEKLHLDNNKLSFLPSELGELKKLRVLSVDSNMLVSIPVELRQCMELEELSLEYNKLVRPLLDFRAMAELEVLRLFGNPLEFLPEILPLRKLRHLSLAGTRIVSDENLRSVNVQIETENNSYFGASKHKLSSFFSLIFRFSSCHHPLLASALTKIMEDQGNRNFVSKDENAVRQLISMISSENRHVVQHACSALSSLAADVSVAVKLMKCDIMQPIETALRFITEEEVLSVLQVVMSLAFASDVVAQKILTKDVLRSLKSLCSHKNPAVQRSALMTIGDLGFCLDNRRILVASESLRELLMRLTAAPEPSVNKAAARVLAILGENENLRRAIKGRPVPKQGLRILSMDGGGMKGLATVQMLKEIEKGTGKRIHELFDLICGTSTGGMLAVALGIKSMTLDQCEEIYKNLGKLVFTEPAPKDNEAASWRERLDQLYKSSSQSFRVVVHGSKHSADQFEKLLKEMCADEDGDLLIDSAVRNIPKVFVVATLVSVTPAQPFIFRNYQYPAGTPEVSLSTSEGSGVKLSGSSTIGAQVGYNRSAFIGSCKHHLWQAIRASSAAPYYLDDFSDDIHRWQDGAIVANNPTIFAIREAQLLWPDTRIDCLVSISCGSVVTKVRKGGWRYLDTGQVLIESACSVERVEEAMSTLLPMLPEMQYFRFNPVDERYEMELDETDPAIWLKLEAATDEYIQNNSKDFKKAIDRLMMPFQHNDKLFENSRPLNKAKASDSEAYGPSLGWRRNVLLIEALHSPDSGRTVHHVHALGSFCARSSIRISVVHGTADDTNAKPGAAFPTPFSSPLFTGSFPSSPHLYGPAVGHQMIGNIDTIPPLSLDGQLGKISTSPPTSPSRLRELSLPARSLQEKLLNSPQVGIVHLSLQSDPSGLILSWQNDVFVVAEPGELADKFVQSVKMSLLSQMGSRRKKGMSFLTGVSTVADLVASTRQFQVGCIVHRYIGCQTQVMEDDQEISAYMFRRTVPATHLTSDDVRWMVGAWRDRIIISTGKYSPNPTLVKAFLDSGAKAVICSSVKPPEAQLTTFHGSGDLDTLENGKFELGEEDIEEEVEPASPKSDWEDTDPEDNNDRNRKGFWDDEEAEVSRFVCELYDTLFREGASVGVALRRALASNKKLRYTCHVPPS
ncbi:hypothetical protein MLD38_021076 [Melastoma candidum]|uniref:Uncharacterized protein n=1 Tax=Melastoma candidum TaxID=119954 RepID=A0ACB9QF59_9MYRT|nr:hypothetical protein MLD38_021076 [Melastoma candidum]